MTIYTSYEEVKMSYVAHMRHPEHEQPHTLSNAGQADTLWF